MRHIVIPICVCILLAGIGPASAPQATARGGGGDHGSGDTGRDRGDTHQTWCDINPACNGWNEKMAYAHAHGFWGTPAAVVAPPARAAYAYVPLPKPRVAYVKPVVKKPVTIAVIAPRKELRTFDLASLFAPR